MRKLHRRRCRELWLIGAAVALIAAPPAGALAAGEESDPGSTPGEVVVESPDGSTESAVPPTSSPAATAPASPGWTAEGAGTGTSSAEAPPVRHGSSVGSGGSPEKARSTSTGPSNTTGSTSEGPAVTGSNGYDEPTPSTPASVEEPGSTLGAGSGTGSVEPPATVASTGRAAELAIGAASPLAFSRSPQGADIGSGSRVAAATFSGPDDQAASGSYVLPLLAIVVLSLLGYAGVHLRRRHWQRRLEAVKHQREATWTEVIRQIETRRALGTLERSAERLQKIDVG